MLNVRPLVCMRTAAGVRMSRRLGSASTCMSGTWRVWVPEVDGQTLRKFRTLRGLGSAISVMSGTWSGRLPEAEGHTLSTRLCGVVESRAEATPVVSRAGRRRYSQDPEDQRCSVGMSDMAHCCCLEVDDGVHDRAVCPERFVATVRGCKRVGVLSMVVPVCPARWCAKALH